MKKSALQAELQGQKILVTGGTGSIGGVAVKRLIAYKPALIRVMARDEYRWYILKKELETLQTTVKVEHCFGDIANLGDVQKAMRGITHVIHAAGMKHIIFCEENADAAIRTNVTGAQNIRQAAEEAGVKKVVAVSTDKAVHPSSVMGITKLLMEKVFCAPGQDTNTRCAVTRFGNVRHSLGSVLPYWESQAQQGLPINLTDKKMRRFFMSIDEGVDSILYTLEHMSGGEIFIRQMKEVLMYDLAKEILAQHRAAGSKIVITGAAKGEKLDEHLYTDEEATRLSERDGFWILASKSR